MWFPSGHRDFQQCLVSSLGGSFRDGFTSGKRRLFSHPQSLSFPCWTGTEGSPFDEQEDLSFLADSSRSWPCHWPHIYIQGEEMVLGHPQLLCLLYSLKCVGKSKGISPSLVSRPVFLLHHLKNRLAGCTGE